MRRATALALFLAYMTGPAACLTYAQSLAGYIQTIGIGMPDPSTTNETQRQATAREAALTEAQAKMLSLLQSQSPSSTADPEKLKAGILQGAYVSKTEWTHDGGCRVTLRLKKP